MDDTKKIIERYKRELMEMSKAAGSAKPADQGSRETPKREPQIIGYVSEDNKTYDNFLEELVKMPSDTAAEPSPEPDDFPDEIFDSAENDAPEDEEDQTTSDTDMDPDTDIDDIGTDIDTDVPEEPLPPSEEIIDETVTGGQPIFTPPNYTEIPSTEQVRREITEQSDPADNVPEQNVSGVTDNSATTPRPSRTETQTTTPEQAERLNDQPVSGSDPDEQLTGRSFEKNAPPPPFDIGMERGSRAEPADFPKPVFNSYEDFKQQNPGNGTIIFRVYTGRQAVPLENAECVLYTKINGGNYEIARLLTNSSGQTPVQELPTPDKELSQHADNQIQAFALYDAKVTKKGFSQVILEDIPVFDGVQSVQRVFMIVDE